MAALNYSDNFAKEILEAVHNMASGGDVIKLALSNTAITAANATLAAITEISPGNGYSAGGPTLTSSTSAPSTGQGAFTIADYTLTASGGTIATFRYGLIYNSSKSNKSIQYFDLGAAVSLTVGNSQLFDFSATAGNIT